MYVSIRIVPSIASVTVRTGVGTDTGTGSWLWPRSPSPTGGQDTRSQRNAEYGGHNPVVVDCRALPRPDHGLGNMLGHSQHAALASSPQRAERWSRRLEPPCADEHLDNIHSRCEGLALTGWLDFARRICTLPQPPTDKRQARWGPQRSCRGLQERGGQTACEPHRCSGAYAVRMPQTKRECWASAAARAPCERLPKTAPASFPHRPQRPSAHWAHFAPP